MNKHKQFEPKKKSNTSNISKKKIFLWIIGILIFYVYTSAIVTTQTVEKELKNKSTMLVQEPSVVEKLVKTTLYKEEKVPYGVPDCAQLSYNFSFEQSYTTEIIDGTTVGKCSFVVKNEEDIAGTFSFKVQFLRVGENVEDSATIVKRIDAYGTETFVWVRNLGSLESMSCLLQSNPAATRMKCRYAPGAAMYVKQIPYTLEELKNVTEYKEVNKTVIEVTKQNVTENVYKNRFFGYNQFFFFGY